MSVRKTAILGLGQTGESIANYLQAHDIPFCAFDSRESPPELDYFQQQFPACEVYCGEFNAETLKQFDQIVISPGIALQTSAVQAAIAAGVEVMGDVELFARAAKVPIVAITGSNGKTTVTTLFGEMAAAAGIKVAVGGNIGTPALDLLNVEAELYVLELSSFQLETTHSLNAKVTVNLNICEDHLDRYTGLQAYINAKLRIYQQTEIAVVNLDDSVAWQENLLPKEVIAFSALEKTFPGALANINLNVLSTLCLSDYYPYQLTNFLAAWSLGVAIDLPHQAMLSAIENFAGLPHRCQKIAEQDSIMWINDSKATNVGAAIAAIESVAERSVGKIVLLAGGDSKGADLSPLTAAINDHCRCVILLGRDRERLKAIITSSVKTIEVDDLKAAVITAAQQAQANDTVLLSPACASLDMFKNYIERGEVFSQYVREIVGE